MTPKRSSRSCARKRPSKPKSKAATTSICSARFMFGAGMFPTPDPINKNPITAPAKGVNAEYGKYIATFGECRGCHGPNMTGSPPNRGATRRCAQSASDCRHVDARAIYPNDAHRRQTDRARNSRTRMPWVNASRMNDEDLSALYEYFKAKP